jgi:hypothetical protein
MNAHYRRGLFTLFFCTIFLFALSPVAKAEQQGQGVLFDEGHGMRFVIGMDGPLHLSGLADILRARGATVESSQQKLTKNLLAGHKALIISGPFHQYSRGEIDAVINFVLEGGKVAIMLHIPMPVSSLLYRFNVTTANGVIQEQDNIIDGNDKYFTVFTLADHPVTKGLDSFSLYGAWPLLCNSPNVSMLAVTGPKAWIDLDHNGKRTEADTQQPFGVIAAGRLGKGEYLVFGDDSIFQNSFLKEQNVRLAENLADWLLK